MAEEKKYTQADMDKAMANKDKEVSEKYEAKIKDLEKSHTDELSNARSESFAKGKDRGQMSAEEQHKAEQKDREKELKKQWDDLHSKQTKMQKDMSINSIKGKLKAENIPEYFAANLYNENSEEQQKNVEEFIKNYKDSVQSSINEKLKGKGASSGQSSENENKTKLNDLDINDVSLDQFRNSLQLQMEIYRKDPEKYKKLRKDAYK